MIKLTWITPDAEKMMAYCARVSAPKERQESGDLKLLSYCMREKHWSVFEMANACLEITTTRAISRQLLRHRSFNFQELSQRYQNITTLENMFSDVQARRQDKKNRQNSIDDLQVSDREWFQEKLKQLNTLQKDTYQEALQKGIAKESARFFLGENAISRLYVNGTVRSWLHYLQVRAFGKGVQKEHRELAKGVHSILQTELPTVISAADKHLFEPENH